ncbi:PAS domain S-box-containing protein [Endobacter medicaginis]|uniref:histidine kinase n=1 Tax=Endobacter medicaginis TaxID=1181271 RepID=A0A850NPQ1_9PROT|nr:histidine kinase famiy protein [Endobacter medicaginis]MBB3174618.1 PAS domain S-box-containing protein [Endobacter medicaginis]MCX5474690.1 histidine kinase famiy protein [Endobacter medicaginis]NVN30884.1 PAS domain-containing protein [Endobacter medicaginis]
MTERPPPEKTAHDRHGTAVLPASGGFVSGATLPDIDDTHNGIFVAAVATTRMPMIVTDPNLPDNPIVFANPAFLAMTGYGREELLGRNCRFLQGAETDPDAVAEVRSAVAERRETAVEILNYKKSGAAFWNALFVSPVFDLDGRLLYFFGSQLDITRRHDAEEALRQAQKMEAVGQLTGGIAHDFNNLLTVILGFGEMVINQLDRPETFDPARARRAMSAVMAATERGATLTQQMLAFARRQKLDGRVVDLIELVRRMRPVMERTLGPGITLELCDEDGAAGCTARLDPTQAELAVVNILVNARDAMPDGGRLRIETASCVVSAEDQGYGRLPPGAYAMLTITDSGTGMSPEVLSRVTEPFFTTKDQGQGTGLGLSMVYGFMKQSGGALRITSEPGHGTTLRLLFPRAHAAAEAITTPRAEAAEGGDETILLVEDQPDVGDYAEEVLAGLGYTVLRAGNAQQALERLEAVPGIELLFTDLIMPGGMNGVMLAREARRRRPGLRVLLTTGYAESSIERVDAGGQAFDLIEKPYKGRDLARRVRRALTGANGIG